jgi:hypothetical protein
MLLRAILHPISTYNFRPSAVAARLNVLNVTDFILRIKQAVQLPTVGFHACGHDGFL